MRISNEVIHSVHIYLATNDLAQAGSIDKSLDILSSQAMPVQDLPQLTSFQEFNDALMICSEKWSQGRFGGMRERPVADIMQERSRTYQQPIFFFQAKMTGEERGHMVSPEAMLESGMVSTGIDEIRESELLYPAQPLHLRGVRQLQCQAFQPYIAMHRIPDLGHWVD
jgi:hypothetical protein